MFNALLNDVLAQSIFVSRACVHMVRVSSSPSHVGEEYCGCFVNALFVLERVRPRAVTLRAGRNEMALMVV